MWTRGGLYVDSRWSVCGLEVVCRWTQGHQHELVVCGLKTRWTQDEVRMRIQEQVRRFSQEHPKSINRWVDSQHRQILGRLVRSNTLGRKPEKECLGPLWVAVYGLQSSLSLWGTSAEGYYLLPPYLPLILVDHPWCGLVNTMAQSNPWGVV